MVVRGQELLRTFRRLLRTTISRTTLTFVAGGMRHGIDAMLPHGKLVVRTVRQLFGNLSPRKTTLILVAAGLSGLALILVLLEISLRIELAKEASDTAIDAAPSESSQKMEFADAFPIQPKSFTLLQSVDQLGAATSSSDYAQTFGQVPREPVPLPRPRKPR